MTGRPPPRPYPSLLFRRVRALILLAVLVALVSTGVHLVRGGPDDAGAAPVPAPVPTTAEAPPPTPEQTLDAAVRSGQSGKGRLALAVTDLSTGSSASYGATSHPFATASIVKVDILATLLLQRDGKLTATQRSQARAMIQQSSNGAASALWKAIGREKGLDTANATFGLVQTKGGTRGRWGATTTTTADQLRLLRVVFTDDSPLDADARRYLTSLMGHVAADQDWGVTAAAAQDGGGGGKAYVKNGWLPRSGGWVVNSIGSVQRGGHTLLMVALSDGGKSQQRGIAALELVSANAARVVSGV